MPSKKKKTTKKAPAKKATPKKKRAPRQLLLDLSTAVRSSRERSKQTRKELGAKLGISAGEIRNIELKGYVPPAQTLKRLREIFPHLKTHTSRLPMYNSQQHPDTPPPAAERHWNELWEVLQQLIRAMCSKGKQRWLYNLGEAIILSGMSVETWRTFFPDIDGSDATVADLGQ